MKRIGILGSTGSIGTQTLEIVREIKNIEVVALSAGANVELLAKQAIEFNVPLLCTKTQEGAKQLEEILRSAKAFEEASEYLPCILHGESGIEKLAQAEMDMLVTGIVGMRGLLPTLKAIEKGTDIALANKETLVVAGSIVTKKAKEHNVQILPVDSEHSAVFQALQGNRRSDLEKIILTASGGPFRGRDHTFLSNVTVAETLNHPTWKMGGKITVDCATMMNKGLEIIEAMHLFDLNPEQIHVVVHPESIIHSMVMYQDGSVIAQMGNPDMRVPIQYAITYPNRLPGQTRRLNLAEIGKLTFEEPDEETFVCLALAKHAAQMRGTLPAIVNGANEVAVEYFLKGMINFTKIPYIISKAVDAHMKDFEQEPSLEDILECDKWARSFVSGMSL